MPGSAAEDLRHADRQRHRAARCGPPRLSPTACSRAAAGSRSGHARASRRPGRRRVDGEVVARVQRAGGDQRHDADEALDQHRAVADRPDVASPCRSSSASCPSRSGAWKPEIAPQAIVMNTNGKSGPGMIGPPPRGELRERRHLQLGVDDDDADDQQRDRADLHERAEVVARASSSQTGSTEATKP